MAVHHHVVYITTVVPTPVPAPMKVLNIGVSAIQIPMSRFSWYLIAITTAQTHTVCLDRATPARRERGPISVIP